MLEVINDETGRQEFFVYQLPQMMDPDSDPIHLQFINLDQVAFARYESML